MVQSVLLNQSERMVAADVMKKTRRRPLGDTKYRPVFLWFFLFPKKERTQARVQSTSGANGWLRVSRFPQPLVSFFL
jgi:hypothetical protein